jgi:MoaA/NifB/PqqE/SkfB family radical SAM enzyme
VTRDFFEEFELDLTGTCNLQCPLCTRNYAHAKHNLGKKTRPLKDIIEQLDTFPNLKRAFVAGQVSEPTTHPEFHDYLRYLKSRNIYIELFTNGSLHDEKYWETVAEILDESDQIHFTVCGSNQKLHETYRVNSDLKKILRNAKAVRGVKPIDYLQLIRFQYNADDIDSPEMQKIKDDFTHWYFVETEGIRRINEKIRPVPDGVEPLETRDRAIKWLFSQREKITNEAIDKYYPKCVKCKSYNDRKIYINSEGEISACYIHYEFSPEHTFEGNEFDYTDIMKLKYPDCWLCTPKAQYYIEKFELDFVC